MNTKEAIEKVKEKFIEYKENEEVSEQDSESFEENWDREEEEL